MKSKTGRTSPLPFEMPRAPTVLIILDMISDFEFPGAREVLRAARRIAPNIARLKDRAARAKVPVIYVNDNLQQWRSDSQALVRRCVADKARGSDVVRQLEPSPEDFIVLKPRHSGFYATPLSALLDEAHAKDVILTGVSSHQCVLFTANDAYLRELNLKIPRDCVASATSAQLRLALDYFRSVLGADIRSSARLRF